MKNFKDKKIKLLKSEIFRILSDTKTPLNYKQIRKKLNFNFDENINLIEILNNLCDKKKIIKTENFKFFYKEKEKENLVTGILTHGGRKEFFCKCDLTNKTIAVPKKFLKGALINDKVVIKLYKIKKSIIGKVVEIVNRSKEFFVGTLYKKNNTSFVVPIEKYLKTDFYIPRGKCLKANHNDRVIVKLLDWPEAAKSPFGEITKILGISGDLNSELKSITIRHNIKENFSAETIKYVNKLKQSIKTNDIKRRKDFRDHICFTIDPVDAKDFDDALSVKKIKENIFEVGVHIADVSHYIQPSTTIDKEASERGCSVYLANKVIPMLPEKIANEICSLRPKEDKLCFSIVFNIDINGNVLSNWIGKTVINSKKRFTYGDAQETLNIKEGEFYNELFTLDCISKKLRAERIKNGSVIIEKKEIRIAFENDKPIKPYYKEPLSTNKLVEEFMLLANKYVCEYYNKKFIGIYRIHDYPDMEKLEYVKKFLTTMEITFNYNNKNLASKINTLLTKVKSENCKYIINQLVLNSMSKAEYSTKNIGHFGLGFEKYSHFTSPIRRYPDLLAHRQLNYIIEKENAITTNLEDLCKISSKKERNAIKAERDYMKFLLLWLIKDKKGAETQATITAIKEWGVYAELNEYLCEGLIPLSSLKKSGNYYYNNTKNEIINKKNGESLFLGKNISVAIENIDLMKYELDLAILT